MAGFLLGCGGDPFDAGEEREFDHARAHWVQAALAGYEVEARLSCFCEAALPVFTRLVVHAGEVVAAAALEPAPAPATIPLDAWPTVPQVFELIESAARQSVYIGIDAQFDPELGYPRHVELRCKPDLVDCGATYELRNLMPVDPGK
jgi:hypothetical protein